MPKERLAPRPPSQPQPISHSHTRMPQALVTRTGPVENLTAHLSSPFSNNISGSIDNLPNLLH